MGKFIIQQRSMHNAVYAVEPLAHSSSNQGMVCGILLWRQKYDKCHHGAGACYCILQNFGGQLIKDRRDEGGDSPGLKQMVLYK